jgi:two-component system chemotaxis sensor kinase CheA
MKSPLTFDIEADELEIFLQDVNEHLQTMEAGILHLEQGADPDTLNAVFRAAHTLKAVAATVGHQQMAELTHTLETLFGAMREGRLAPTQAVTDELLVTVDALRALRDEVVSRQASGIDVAAILTRLRALMDSAAGEERDSYATGVITHPAVKDSAESAQKSPLVPTSQEREETVRISVERLDTLMNLVGELVTERTRLAQVEDALCVQYGKGGAIGELSEMATHFSRVVDQLQQEVMEARMLPVAHLFNKFPRLVRDLARAADKQVDLVIEGEATELDRSIIEAISDPLIHLLRNAVGHGIESPQARVAAGKPASGALWLTAAHAEGHIVITVKDDGQGIDPAQIRRAAVSRGLLSEEEAAQLDDGEAVALIFQPNLSTAGQVTGVSGRGVGLDVVRTNVNRLSGSVMVESEIGHGATFRVTLPLTLAIVQAMLVVLGEDVYAIPLSGVVESMYLSDVHISNVKGNPAIYWRDQALPLLYLRQFFAHPRLAAAPPDGARSAVVVVSWGALRVGLVVDKLVGKQEIVVKSLSPIIGRVPGLSACTILGDGRIALIMDIPGVIGAAMQAQRQGLAT